MLLPIGHSDFDVRRLPWVTFGIMAACVLVFLLAATTAPARPDSADQIDAFVEYFFEHPYLELSDPQKEFLARLLFETGLSRDVDAFIEIARESYGQPPPRDAARLRQEADRLEQLYRGAIAEFEEFTDPGLMGSLALIPADLTLHGLVTYMFAHAGFMHLFFNMLFLYLAGPFIEDRWGRPVFAAFYLAGGVLSGLVFALRYPASEVMLVGASGAIAAVMGAFLILFWRSKITFFYWFFFVFVGTFEAPAWLMLPLWFVRETLFAQAVDVMDPTGQTGGTAYLAHVAGFAFGVTVALVIRQYRIEERYLQRAIEAKADRLHVSNTVVDRAMDDASRGGVDRAAAGLRDALAEDPDNLDAAVALWGLEVGRGRAAVAVPVMVAAVRRALRSGDEDFVAAHWPEVADEAGEVLQLEPVEAYRIADVLERFGERSRARDVIDSFLAPVGPESPEGVAIRLARLARQLDSARAPALAHEALRRAPAEPVLREELEEIAASGAAEPVPVDRLAPAVHEPAAPPSGVAPPEPLDAGRPTVIDVDAPGHRIEAVEVVPRRMVGETLVIEARGASRDLSLGSVQAIAVGGIKPEGDRPFLVVDLMLDPPWSDRAALRALRLRSNTFDPRRLVGGEQAVAAFRQMIQRMLEASGAVPLPDPEAAAGNPFRTYTSLASYERAVLGR